MATGTSLTPHRKLKPDCGRYDYALFELEFDQDLYYIQNWPCGCTETFGACTTRRAPKVDESGTFCVRFPLIVVGESIQVLEVDKWTTVCLVWIRCNKSSQITSSFYSRSILAFDLEPTEANPCPIFVIETNTIEGRMAVAVANDAIPSFNDGIVTWVKVCIVVVMFLIVKVYDHLPDIWICPTDKNFAFGRYYIEMVPTLPQTVQQVVKVKISTKSNLPFLFETNKYQRHRYVNQRESYPSHTQRSHLTGDGYKIAKPLHLLANL